MSKYELYHHGILGMKWGIRRYQNKDGSLTAEGRKRYYNTATQVTRGVIDVNSAFRKQNAAYDSARDLKRIGEEDAASKLREDANRNVESKISDLRNALLNSANARLVEEYNTNLKYASKYADRAREEMDAIISNPSKINEYVESFFSEVYTKDTLEYEQKEYGLSVDDIKNDIADSIRNGSDYMKEYIVSKNSSIKKWSEMADNCYKDAINASKKIVEDAVAYASKKSDFDRLVLKDDKKGAGIAEIAIGQRHIEQVTKTEHSYSSGLNIWYNYRPPNSRKG